MHAELKIGDSIIFLADEMPQPGSPKSPQTLGGVTGTIQLYVANVDDLFKQAITAGCKETMSVANQFWGDRWGSFTDPFGHSWGIGTHKEDLTAEEMGQRAQEFFSNFAKQKTA
jgi:PhnB protein